MMGWDGKGGETVRSKKITKEEYDKLMYGGDEGSEAEDGDSD
jgi:hypothetical protein